MNHNKTKKDKYNSKKFRHENHKNIQIQIESFRIYYKIELQIINHNEEHIQPNVDQIQNKSFLSINKLKGYIFPLTNILFFFSFLYHVHLHSNVDILFINYI